MLVKIKKIHPDAVMPKQATEYAGGWDVVATEIEEVYPGYVICKLGFAMQPPVGYKVTLVPRSSITKTPWLIQNSPGLGDCDFTEEYQLRFRCLPVSRQLFDMFSLFNLFSKVISPFPYKKGDRIGQIYLEEVIPIEFEAVDELVEYGRGLGYGSTGN
jgi:dUTP pyrophosphatase